MRRCACPREEAMDGMPESIVYRHGDRCHKRAYRNRVKRAAEAAGLEVAPSLRAIRATKRAKAPAGQTESVRKRAQNRRPDLRVSYRKAQRHAEATRSPEVARQVAEVLQEVLTDRQCRSLEDR